VNELPLGCESVARHQACGSDCAGIDHRVGSPVGTAFDGGERIEWHSGGVRAELLARLFRAHLLTDEREHERLGHAHDREFVIGVAGGIDVAADADHAHAEQFAPRPGQRRVNSRILAVGIGFESRVRLAYQRRDSLRGREVTGRDERRVEAIAALAPLLHLFLPARSRSRADADARSPAVFG
jgi:hypothetical protein